MSRAKPLRVPSSSALPARVRRVRPVILRPDISVTSSPSLPNGAAHRGTEQQETELDRAAIAAFREGARTLGERKQLYAQLRELWGDEVLNMTVESHENRKRGGKFVHPGFDDFADFVWHVGPRTQRYLTLDRLDNNKGYVPGNVGWKDQWEQSGNRGNTIMLTVDGVTHSLVEWARITNQEPQVLRRRRAKGWSDREVVYGRDDSTPHVPDNAPWPPQLRVEFEKAFQAQGGGSYYFRLVFLREQMDARLKHYGELLENNSWDDDDESIQISDAQLEEFGRWQRAYEFAFRYYNIADKEIRRIEHEQVMKQYRKDRAAATARRLGLDKWEL